MAAKLKSADARVLYLYAITESRLTKLPTLMGVDMLAEVEPIEAGGLTCWTSRVSALDFEENLARNMENLEWLAEASVAHQRVVSALSQELEALPARFGTVFQNEASLRRHVRSRASELKRDLARIKGADEWGVKVFAVKSAVRPIGKIQSGKDYLKAKAALLPKRRPATIASTELAEFDEALKQVAAETAAIGSVSSGQRGLTYQKSLLVKRTDREKLESILKKFADDWAEARRIECTGPWPPYSFMSRPGAEAE